MRARSLPLRAIIGGVGIGLLAAALLPAANASVTNGEQAVLVSGERTARDCPAHAGSITNAEAEPSLAVDPENRRHLVAAWKQDYGNGTDSLTDVSAYSLDRGATWRVRKFPALSQCEGGTAANATDPWISYGPNGTVWAATLPYTGQPGAIVVYRSIDGGRHWSAPHTVDRDLPVLEFDDKEVIAADPKRPGAAYVVWAKFIQDPVAGLPLTGTIYFSRTSDGGRHWTRRAALARAPLGAGVQSGAVEVLPSGRLVVTYAVVHPDDPLACTETCSGEVTEKAIHSDDGGSSWSRPVVITSYREMPPRDPETGDHIAAQNEVVSVALARSGTLYFAAHAEPRSGPARIVALRSTDGGSHWQPLPAVPPTPSDPFQPTISAGRGGLALMWFDTRRNVPGDGRLTAGWWFASSTDGGSSWSESHLAGPFDLRSAPDETRHADFIGDYFGLQPLGRRFGALFVEARPASVHGPTDVFFSPVTP